jgi:hypothetical protein
MNLLSWWFHKAKLKLYFLILWVLAGKYFAAAEVYFFNPKNVPKEMWMEGIRKYPEETYSGDCNLD